METDNALESIGFEELFNDLIEPADEGLNMDIAKLVKEEDVKKARKLIKESRSLAREKKYTEAISTIREAVPLINKMKEIVNGMPDGTKFERFLSYFTPIFSTLPTEELISVITVGNTFIFVTKSYQDSMSKNTKNSVKARLQLKFNYLCHNINMYIQYWTLRSEGKDVKFKRNKK